ncbi:MAG: 1,4-alpha-glucan branching enzyme, partial [Verrucomicrobiota bacterium]
MSSKRSTYTSDPNAVAQVLSATHADPFGFLGLHQNPTGSGFVLRVFRPESRRVIVHPEVGQEVEMTRIDPAGFYEAVFSDREEDFGYLLTYEYPDNEIGPVPDVYHYGPIFGEQDLHFFGEGNHRHLWKVMGAHVKKIGDFEGTTFAVWAPNAHRVSVVGDFNAWDGRVHPMRNQNGVWEIFIPGITNGEHYKFEIVGAEGNLFNKSDPYAFFSQHGTQTASITYDLNRYVWNDDEWMKKRGESDPYHGPMSIYEVHLGSWKRRFEEENRFLTYLELADELVDYVVD